MPQKQYFRLSHRLWKRGLKLFARWLSQIMRGITGIEIHPGATIGRNLFIDHSMGDVGDHETIYHGVTLGRMSLHKTKRHPTIEDHVVIGPGAKVLGAITIGAHSPVEANAVLVREQPSLDSSLDGKADLEHGRLPDTITETLTALIAHVESL
jgi:serine O-acetyltransferase